MGRWFVNCPAVAGNMLVVGVLGGTVYGIKRSTGADLERSPRWVCDLNAATL